jgi:hypothetical protein
MENSEAGHTILRLVARDSDLDRTILYSLQVTRILRETVSREDLGLFRPVYEFTPEYLFILTFFGGFSNFISRQEYSAYLKNFKLISLFETF